MQGMANHQHDRDLHAGRRQHQDHDLDFLEDRRGVYGREKVGHLLNSPKVEGEHTLPFAVCGIISRVIDKERTPALVIVRAGVYSLKE